MIVTTFEKKSFCRIDHRKRLIFVRVHKYIYDPITNCVNKIHSYTNTHICGLFISVRRPKKLFMLTNNNVILTHTAGGSGIKQPSSFVLKLICVRVVTLDNIFLLCATISQYEND